MKKFLVFSKYSQFPYSSVHFTNISLEKFLSLLKDVKAKKYDGEFLAYNGYLNISRLHVVIPCSSAMVRVEEDSEVGKIVKLQVDVGSHKAHIYVLDEVEVFLTQKETLEKIVATDRVKINQGEKINGSCQKVTYFAQEDILVLEGEVEYQDNIGNTLQAQKVTIWAKEKKLQAEGKPVKAIYILKGEESVTTGGESK